MASSDLFCFMASFKKVRCERHSATLRRAIACDFHLFPFLARFRFVTWSHGLFVVFSATTIVKIPNVVTIELRLSFGLVNFVVNKASPSGRSVSRRGLRRVLFEDRLEVRGALSTSAICQSLRRRG